MLVLFALKFSVNFLQMLFPCGFSKIFFPIPDSANSRFLDSLFKLLLPQCRVLSKILEIFLILCPKSYWNFLKICLNKFLWDFYHPLLMPVNHLPPVHRLANPLKNVCELFFNFSKVTSVSDPTESTFHFLWVSFSSTWIILRSVDFLGVISW